MHGIKLQESQSHHFFIHLVCFSFFSNAVNLFINSLKRFVFSKNAYALLVFYSRVPYMQISDMIQEVSIISRKVCVASVDRGGGFGGVLRPQQGF